MFCFARWQGTQGSRKQMVATKEAFWFPPGLFLFVCIGHTVSTSVFISFVVLSLFREVHIPILSSLECSWVLSRSSPTYKFCRLDVQTLLGLKEILLSFLVFLGSVSSSHSLHHISGKLMHGNSMGTLALACNTPSS